MLHLENTMVYLMHVNWFWIKQRPHFLAEKLRSYFNITVLSPESFRENKQLIITKKPSFVKFYKILPLQRFKKSIIHQRLDNAIIICQIRKYVKKSKYIWITSPLDYLIVRKCINQSQLVVYDCMDDFLEFPSIKSCSKLTSNYFVAEQELLVRANAVFASSKYLKEKLQARYKGISQIFVINNAISSTFFIQNNTRSEVTYPENYGFTDLIYIGTISYWLDFDLLLESLVHFNKIRYILIGPSERNIPIHDRIIYLGLRKHKELLAYMKKANALIMPFIVNDLIKSVNPVKLYEYISSGRPIITCSYEEIEQFNGFGYKYNNNSEYFVLLDRLIKNELKQKEDKICRDFLESNNWENRADLISKMLL